jgi:putative DNA primase/helicase
VRAEGIAKALGGRKVGTNWMARCPAHDDRDPSLAIQDTPDGKVLVRCHAGCDQRRVIAALRSRGLWENNSLRHGYSIRRQSGRSGDDQRDPRDKRTIAALNIWQFTAAGVGTLVETYLRARGLTIPPPPSLRFHPGLKHRSGNNWPAIVALVTRGTDDAPVAVHRTYLARDGKSKALVEPSKMMLGPTRGGAVRLAPLRDVLMVGEGIETCLAAMQATGLPAWAALSTSGLRSLDLPNEVRDIIVLADGDDPGEAAAQDCGLRWKREGRHVRIARPPRGLDFNDLLLGRAPCIEGDAA